MARRNGSVNGALRSMPSSLIGKPTWKLAAPENTAATVAPYFPGHSTRTKLNSNKFSHSFLNEPFFPSFFLFAFFLMKWRRDSFITHRAFCDALAQESARSQTQSLAITNEEGTLKVQAQTTTTTTSSSSPPPPPLTPSTGVLSPVLSIQSSGG